MLLRAVGFQSQEAAQRGPGVFLRLQDLVILLGEQAQPCYEHCFMSFPSADHFISRHLEIDTMRVLMTRTLSTQKC